MHFFDAPFTTPGELMHEVDGAWTDIDLTAHLGADAGNVAGVYIYVRNTLSGNDIGFRKNGSTDTFIGRISNNHECYFAVGVDGDDIFEAFADDASNISLWLFGYWTNDEAEFLTNAQAVTPASGGVWTSTDLSSYFTGTVQAAFFTICNTNAALPSWGCQDIDGPDRYGTSPEAYCLETGVAPATSESCELYTSTTTSTTIYCVGAIISGFTKFTDTIDITGADAWEDDKSLSGNATAGDKAFIYHYHDGTGDDADVATRCMIRKAGQSWDNYTYFHGRRAVPRVGALNSTSLTFDVKAEDAAIDLYILGSFGDASASEAASISSRAHFLRQQQGVA